MGFADAYLLKAGLRELLIKPDPHPDLKISVILPVYNESGLERCLDSLCISAAGLQTAHAEVLILINAPAGAPPEILEQNRRSYKATKSWIADHPHPSINFFVILDHSFGKKDAGVGLARKILMDEAVRRFNQLGLPDGIIASMDADAVVESNYLEALIRHFNTGYSLLGNDLPEACSIYFEHPLDVSDSKVTHAETYSPAIYSAIVQYELHLRYYLQAVRSTGYPYAFHTVGSSFAVRSDVYCMEGGMNRRKGGEDFYFIQKVAQRGKFSECQNTRVIPSPRPSNRVPFGTGPVVEKLSSDGEVLTTYDPRPFAMLRQFFEKLDMLYTDSSIADSFDSLPEVIIEFLETQEYSTALSEIRGNSASYPAFLKRFWRWFNMFRIMKFLHFARERGYPDVPVGEASSELLNAIDPASLKAADTTDIVGLLSFYRRLERPCP